MPARNYANQLAIRTPLGRCNGPFVRSGFSPGVRLRLSLDAGSLADAPGRISTSDGLLRDGALRPIPELLHDPLASLTFGDGHVRDVVLAVDPADASAGPTMLAFVSLLHDDGVELRLVRGAPPARDALAVPAVNGAPIFAVFPLRKEPGACGF